MSLSEVSHCPSTYSQLNQSAGLVNGGEATKSSIGELATEISV